MLSAAKHLSRFPVRPFTALRVTGEWVPAITVMLSAAKHLSRSRDRPFAALRVTWCWDGMIRKIYFPYKKESSL